MRILVPATRHKGLTSGYLFDTEKVTSAFAQSALRHQAMEDLLATFKPLEDSSGEIILLGQRQWQILAHVFGARQQARLSTVNSEAFI